jgi:hypothetical protein
MLLTPALLIIFSSLAPEMSGHHIQFKAPRIFCKIFSPVQFSTCIISLALARAR